jgi:tetratricopeptide (TPR) repeat protein/predicted Ser/Thr protein kinase
VVADRFEIEAILGIGGMGVVFSARDRRLDRPVAVKAIRTDARRRALEAFRREAMAMASLAHPNIVPIFDAGIDTGTPFIAMELVRGRTLRQWQLEQRDPAPILAAYRDAGRGLAAAHDAGIVHRDFKPDNVLVSEAGVIKVADFGVAALRGAGAPPIGSESATHDGTGFVGTPAYAAPEQMAGGTVDARADQFAFCVALWEALDGLPPFPSGPERYLAILAGRFQRGTGAVPRHLRSTLRQGLHAAPDRRLASMTDLVDRLRPRSPARWWFLPFLGLATIGIAIATEEARAPCDALAEERAHLGRRTPGEVLDARHRAHVDAVQTAMSASLRAWDERYRRSCAADAPDPAALDCLRAGLRNRARVLDELDAAPLLIVQQGTAIQDQLAAADRCASAPAMTSPLEASLRDEADAVLARGLLAGPMRTAADLGLVIERTRRSASPELLIGLLLDRAQEHRASGHRQMAEIDAEEAAFLARSRGRDLHTAEALSLLLDIRLDLDPDAETLGRLAGELESLVTGGELPPGTRGLGHLVLARHAQHRLADFDTAMRHLQKAADEFAEAGDKAQSLDARTELSSLYSTRGELTRALEEARRVHEALAADPLADPRRRATAPLPVSRALIRIGELDEALELGDKALEASTRLGLQREAALARANRGHVLWQMQRRDEALAEVRTARRSLEALDERPSEAAASALMLEASILAEAGRPRDAVPLYERAVVLQEAMGSLRLEETLMNLAITCRDLEEDDRAIRLQRRVVAKREARLGPAHLETGFAHMNLGIALDEIAAFAEAEKEQRRALEIFAAQPDLDPQYDVYARLALAKSLFAQARDDEGLAHIEQVMHTPERSNLPIEQQGFAAALWVEMARRAHGEVPAGLLEEAKRLCPSASAYCKELAEVHAD